MDPISQAFLGAVFAQGFSKIKRIKQNLKHIAISGAVGGMAADIDILIRSKSDPLLSIDYHRHFTHSLSFIPIGGLLTAIFLWYFIRLRKMSFKTVLIFTTLGFSTHALLDACTTYGTRLLWPFSNAKISWNIVSIVDPIYTIILITSCILSINRKSSTIAIIGLLISTLYLGLGAIQNNRAKSLISVEAQKRGHLIQKKDIFVSPAFGNNILWRSIYKYHGYYYIDSVSISFFSSSNVNVGKKTKIIDNEKAFLEIPKNSVQRKDIKRFEHFAQGYIYLYTDITTGKVLIGDLRYSSVVNGIKPLWAILTDINKPNSHVKLIKYTNPFK